MIAVLWLLLFSQTVSIVRKPLYITCVRDRQCDPNVWVVGGDWKGPQLVLSIMWLVADGALYTSALLYFFAMMVRFQIFQQALRYPRWTIYALQTFYTLLFFVGLGGDYAYLAFPAGDSPHLYLSIASGSFFLCLAAADIFISALMVHTFMAVQGALHSSRSSLTPSSERKPSYNLDSAEADGTEFGTPGRSRTEYMAVRLRVMLGALVVANVCVLTFFVGGGVVFPNNGTEVSQIAEAWTAFHAILGLIFLSEFKVEQQRLG
ncbi:hypothetical protein HK104_006004 [Borealophlyctis nickersoniae]|nr:hypothetical protein HK104_006004 [Borealophlyctis nickersoniae]